MAAIFGETKMFWKLRWLLCRDTLYVKNFVEITLSSTVLRDISISVFCNFVENFKMAAIFENWNCYSAEIPCGSKFLLKLLYLARFSRYKHFCVLQFLRKIQNGRHFWQDKNFLKIGTATLEISYGSKISSKSIYLARFPRYKHFCVLPILRKIQNGRNFWRDKKFLKIGTATLDIPYGSKISSKSIYLARFPRYKHFCVLPILWKIQNGRNFWRDKIFLKIGLTTLEIYPVGQKVRRNPLFYCVNTFYLTDFSICPAQVGPAKRQKKTFRVELLVGTSIVFHTLDG